MTYRTGNLGSTSQPGKDLIDLITADAVALGWVQVEAAQVETTYTWRVLKSPASINSAGVDFHVGLGWATTGAGTIVMALFEEWDTGTKKASKFAPNTSSLTPGTGGINTQAAASLPATGTTIWNRTVTSAANDTYWYSITGDRLCVTAAPISSTAQRMAWYVGLYESFMSAADDPVPALITDLVINTGSNYSVASSSGPGSAVREPKQASGVTNNFGAGPTTSATSTSIYVKPIAWTGGGNAYMSDSTETFAEVYSARPLVSRVMVTGRATAGIRGLLRDFYFAAAPVASNVGDEIQWTFAGTTYKATKMKSTNSSYTNIFMGQV